MPKTFQKYSLEENTTQGCPRATSSFRWSHRGRRIETSLRGKLLQTHWYDIFAMWLSYHSFTSYFLTYFNIFLSICALKLQKCELVYGCSAYIFFDIPCVPVKHRHQRPQLIYPCLWWFYVFSSLLPPRTPSSVLPKRLSLLTLKPCVLNFIYLWQRKFRARKMYSMTFLWPWPKGAAMTPIDKNVFVSSNYDKGWWRYGYCQVWYLIEFY